MDNTVWNQKSNREGIISNMFMKYRKLGKTNLNLSVIGLGTFQFGGEWGKSFVQTEVDKILEQAYELGINFIDTAECYGNHLSESLIGKALERKRKSWIIATKFGHKFNGHMDRTSGWSPKEVIGQLEQSLKHLKTDYVDLYQFHSGSNEEFDHDGLWTALDKQVKAGKIRYLGISIQHTAVQNDNLYQVKLAKTVNASAIQVVYNMLSQEAEKILLPYCQKEGLGVIARIPLARGYLSGKYSISYQFPKNDIRANQSQEQNLRLIKKVDKIKANGNSLGMTMSQQALAWILRQSVISSCIPGCKSVEQLKINTRAGGLL